jgi:predicted transglutaminase-like protease
MSNVNIEIDIKYTEYLDDSLVEKIKNIISDKYLFIPNTPVNRKSMSDDVNLLLDREVFIIENRDRIIDEILRSM